MKIIKAHALFIRGNNNVPILNMISTNEDSLKRYASAVLGSGVGFKIEQCEVSGFTETARSGKRIWLVGGVEDGQNDTCHGSDGSNG